MQQNLSQHSHRSQSPIFNILQEQNLMSTDPTVASEEKKHENDEKQELSTLDTVPNPNTHTQQTQLSNDDDEDDDITNNHNNESNDTEEVSNNIDDEKTNEANTNTATHNSKPEIPEDEKQSPSHNLESESTETVTVTPKQIEDQKVNNDCIGTDETEPIIVNDSTAVPLSVSQETKENKSETNKNKINKNPNKSDPEMDESSNNNIQRQQSRPQRRKWPRELGLNRTCFETYNAVQTMNANESGTNNGKSSLLWFVHEKLDEHILDRYNYHSFAITAQLIAYPLSDDSCQLRVIDRFYHRFAHTFHSAYLNQLRKQTLHATAESIEEGTFYDAIGGKDVSRRSLIIPNRVSDHSWVDLDGSQIIPSAIAGIQSSGEAVIFFVRIPEKKEEQLMLKVELTLADYQCRDNAAHASIRWHPTSAHTLLVTDRDCVRVYCVDTSFQSVKCVQSIAVSRVSNIVSAKAKCAMIISSHYSFDSYLLLCLNGPTNKSYGLVQTESEWSKHKFESELSEINFLNIYKFEKYESTDPRRVKAKHLDDITDYDTEPVLVAHLSYEYLSESVRAFDEKNGQKNSKSNGAFAEIFIHCIVLTKEVKHCQQNKEEKTYFFATVSKCIGYARSVLTLWSFVESSAECVQRIMFVTPSANTILTSMEYNRYSRPYIILTSTSFDPFQSEYMDSRRKYIDDKVLLRDQSNANAKIFRNRFNESNEKPIIYVDFAQNKDETHTSDTSEGKTNEEKSHGFKTMFHSYMVQIDWHCLDEKTGVHSPFVSTVLSKSDTSPCPQLIPCRSLYRFVESSLIGQKQELKCLKLYTRRQTIGLLRIGVFAFKYFELYTPESIKLRRATNKDSAVQSNELSHTQQQSLSKKLKFNTQILKQRQRSKKEITQKEPTKKAKEITMASYLYAPKMSTNAIANTESISEEPIIENGNGNKRKKIKKSEKEFYSRLDKMLSSHHSTFLRNLDKKIDKRLSESQTQINQRLIGFENTQIKYQNEIYKSIESNTCAIDALAQKWNECPPLNSADMTQCLTKIIADKVMPRYGVYMMAMFKNFCNAWLVPSINNGIEQAMTDTNNGITKEIEIKMKNIQTCFDEIEHKISVSISQNIKDESERKSEPMSAVLSDKANDQIASLVNSQLQQTLALINKSLSNIIKNELQKALAQIQRELTAANNSVSQSFQNQISDAIQAQFKAIIDEMKSVNAQNRFNQNNEYFQRQSQRERQPLFTQQRSVPKYSSHSSLPPHSQGFQPYTPQRAHTMGYRPQMHTQTQQSTNDINDRIMALQMELDQLTTNNTRSHSQTQTQSPSHYNIRPSPYFHNNNSEHRPHLSHLLHGQSSSGANNNESYMQHSYGSHSNVSNYNNPMQELQGKLSELMSTFEHKMRSNNSVNNTNKSRLSHSHSHSNDKESETENESIINKSENRNKRQQSLSLMQQFCAMNEPLKAIDAMMKTTNYDLVIQLFDKYDIEALLKENEAKSNKHKHTLTFDSMNELIAFFADLAMDSERDSNETIKFIEWIGTVIENINMKELSVANLNAFTDSLNKIEYNLTKIPQTKLQIKQVMRCVKYLNLLIQTAKSQIRNTLHKTND